jgi:hypothetical protein
MGSGGVGKKVGRSTDRQGQQWWWMDSVGVLTRWRPGHMVDLEQKRGEDSEEEKPRSGSVTGASTVKNTGMLGLGFTPNRHERRRKRDKAAIRFDTGEA